MSKGNGHPKGSENALGQQDSALPSKTLHTADRQEPSH